MKSRTKLLLAILGVLAALGLLTLQFTPAGRLLVNRWAYSLQKAEDSANYETRKEVEDSCRAMRASYEADRLTYTQYADGSPEEKKWAAAARMRANKTAAVYNEYVLKNSFVWEGNVPADILENLEYIEGEAP